MFDFWFDLPPLLRAGLGILLMLAAAAIFLLTGRVIAIGLFAIGLMFLLFCKAGNDGGYNF